MYCVQCEGIMHKTDEVVELHTRQTWYECEACGGTHTVSERSEQDASQRVGNAFRFSAQPQYRG